AHRFEARNAPAGGADSPGGRNLAWDNRLCERKRTGSVELARAAPCIYLTCRGSVGAVHLGLVQFTPTFQATAPNWEKMRTWAESIPADVIVFPELASCGYMYRDRKEAAAHVESRSVLAPIEAIARRTGRLIVGGFAERAAGAFYDSAFACGPDGTTVYRKIHLWNRETLIFEPGTQPTIIEFQGHRIGLEVCYDLQFPELAAYLARRGAELVVVPTAWAEEPYRPSHGLQPYNHLAIASAFAGGIFVAVVNRTGVERAARFPGQSSLTNPFGQLESLDGEEAVAVKSVDFSQLKVAKRPNAFNDLDHDSKLEIRVNHVQGQDALTQFVGHDMTSDYIRRLTRRKRTRTDLTVDVVTKDGWNVRVKPMAITDRRIQTAKQRVIRTIMTKTVTD